MLHDNFMKNMFLRALIWGYPKVRKGVLFAKRSPFREKDLIFTKRTQETCTGLVFTNYFIVLKVKLYIMIKFYYFGAIIQRNLKSTNL